MAEYTVATARYAKNMMAVKCRSDDNSTWKTRAMRLADSLARSRYSGREDSYIMSKRAAERFVKLYAEGWDATYVTGELRPPKSEAA